MISSTNPITLSDLILEWWEDARFAAIDFRYGINRDRWSVFRCDHFERCLIATVYSNEVIVWWRSSMGPFRDQEILRPADPDFFDKLAFSLKKRSDRCNHDYMTKKDYPMWDDKP